MRNGIFPAIPRRDREGSRFSFYVMLREALGGDGLYVFSRWEDCFTYVARPTRVTIQPRFVNPAGQPLPDGGDGDPRLSPLAVFHGWDHLYEVRAYVEAALGEAA